MSSNTDPFAELDNLLLQIETRKNSKKDTTSQKPLSSQATWQTDVESMLSEIIDPKSNKASKTSSNTSGTPSDKKPTPSTAASNTSAPSSVTPASSSTPSSNSSNASSSSPTLTTASSPSKATNSTSTATSTANYNPNSNSSSSRPSTSAVTSSDSSMLLSVEETKLSKEINSARKDPKGYASLLAKERRPFFEGKILKLPGSPTGLHTEEGVTAVEEAIAFLNSVYPLPELTVSAGMTKAARQAATALGITGEFKASRSIVLLDNFGKFEKEAVEIVGFGTNDAREIVFRFLVGDGNPDRTHRRYIFNPEFKCVGVSIAPHSSQFKHMACVNFANMFYDF